MNRPVLVLLCVCVVLMMLVSSTGRTAAQAGSGYDLSWNVVAGGGGATSGGSYVLTATAGQPATNGASGGGYSLTSGFWFAGSAVPFPLFVPLINR